MIITIDDFRTSAIYCHLCRKSSLSHTLLAAWLLEMMASAPYGQGPAKIPSVSSGAACAMCTASACKRRAYLCRRCTDCSRHTIRRKGGDTGRGNAPAKLHRLGSSEALPEAESRLGPRPDPATQRGTGLSQLPGRGKPSCQRSHREYLPR
jgi:hypothetical protein